MQPLWIVEVMDAVQGKAASEDSGGMQIVNLRQDEGDAINSWCKNSLVHLKDVLFTARVSRVTQLNEEGSGRREQHFNEPKLHKLLWEMEQTLRKTCPWEETSLKSFPSCEHRLGSNTQWFIRPSICSSVPEKASDLTRVGNVRLSFEKPLTYSLRSQIIYCYFID